MSLVLTPAPPSRPVTEPRRRPSEGAPALGLSIAHEINQPLAAIALHAAAASKWLCRPQPDVERALDALALIGNAGRQAGDIVRGLQRLAAGQDHETARVDVDAALRDALRLLRPSLREHGIALKLALGLDGCRAAVNRVQLQQVITNLVRNAIEAHAAAGCDRPRRSDDRPGARRIRVESRCCGGDALEVAVSDNGPGIAPADRALVFAERFSTRHHRAGSGMGLPISLAIARAHGGHLWFEPCAPHGACFRLRLPRHGGPASA